MYLTELTVDRNMLMTQSSFFGHLFSIPEILKLTEKLFEQWNWNWSKEKFPHYRTVSIKMYLNSLSIERIQIFVPFDDLLVHRDIEVRDRSMIKNWLS